MPVAPAKAGAFLFLTLTGWRVPEDRHGTPDNSPYQAHPVAPSWLVHGSAPTSRSPQYCRLYQISSYPYLLVLSRHVKVSLNRVN